MKICNSSFELLRDELSNLIVRYPKLKCKIDIDEIILVGEINFTAEYNDELLSDSYQVKISIPSDYPNNVPTTFELSGKINRDYHKNADGSLCLSTPIDLRMRLAQNPGIINYIDKLLVPYLYRYSYFLKNQTYPFEDYPHGPLGLIKQYCEYFNTNSISVICDLLFYILDEKTIKKKVCPCGSKNKIGDCHLTILLKLDELPREHLLSDLELIINYLKKIIN